MSVRYRVYGLNLQSQLECPLLHTTQSTPDVVIEYGSVPSHISDPLRQTPFSQVKPGEFLIKIPKVASYFITNGNKILIEKEPNASLDQIRIYLLGSALGGILHQRGQTPLHASAIKIKDRAVLIGGKSGAGKSSLAARLLQKGHGFISDDISVIGFDDMMKPFVHAGFPSFRLWKESMQLLDLSSEGKKVVREGIDKYHVKINEDTQDMIKVHAVINLEKNDAIDSIIWKDLDPRESYQVLMENTFRKNLIIGHGNQVPHFKTCSALIQHCQIYKITRHRTNDTLDKLVAFIENICS